jgi:fibro-slime domain-containing protein
MQPSLLRFATVAAIALAGCADSRQPSASGADAGRQPAAAPDAASPAATTDAAALPLDAGANPDPALNAPLPADFTEADIGGYKLGPALSNDDVIDTGLGGQTVEGGCSVMVGVVRDFRGAADPNGHPDFEAYKGKGATTGLLASTLGADGKPVYASQCEAAPDRALCPYGQQTTSSAAFDSWYRSDAAVNLPFLVYLSFAQQAGVYTFESKAFFPLDDAGFGNMGGKRKHNFGFTTEVHTKFLYRGGEHFQFSGDDDLWVFINGKLAIDLGGLHPPESADLDLDAQAKTLGLTPGNTYTLDLFHAERHSASSNFRIDTSLAFTDCGHVTPELL